MRLMILFGFFILIATLWYLRRYMQRLRRQKLSKEALHPNHIAILHEKVTLYSRLSQALKEELHGHINIFLDEKNFIGCAGVVVNDEMRIVVAGNACMLLLQGAQRRFVGFTSIMLYPEAYVAHEVRHDGLVATEQASARAGESWVRGPIVLSWADVHAGSLNADDGHNVVIHEFAHKLDEQSGRMNGLPVLATAAQREAWRDVLTAEYSALNQRAEQGRNKVLDTYGTTSPAEFFAVASESFFEKPVQMQQRLPALYAQLQDFYQIDPASW